ncbi:cancer-related nucleoside-triphosphatase homolog isoform X2 [Mytilus trossulus]|uniref:cancer-related nucleoside-triphosphatase homolog isoform X2 n=1 Tax=Mytilus trossulus TaxID=6551 RepID=UPI0030072D6D
MATNTARIILLTGVPGVGKTTLIKEICKVLKTKSVNVQGFYTQEVRERGQRTGFSVITLDGEHGPLATVQSSSDIPSGRQYTVGKYNVCLQSFENTALPTLQVKDKQNRVIIIDEIGKMELFSQSFIRHVKHILDTKGLTVIATIPVPKGRPLQLVEEVRARPDALVFTITKENRDNILADISSSVMLSLKDNT